MISWLTQLRPNYHSAHKTPEFIWEQGRYCNRLRFFMFLKFYNHIATLDKNVFEFAKKSFASFGVRVGGVLLGLLVSLLLSRFLGPEGLGVLNLSNRVVSFLLLFGLFGIQNIIIKDTAINYQSQQFGEIANMMLSSSICNGMLSLVIALSIGFFSRPICINIFHEPMLVIPLRIALAAMIFQILSRIYSAGLVGLKRIWQSSLVDQALSYLIVAMFLVAFYLSDINIDVVTVAYAFAISRVCVTVTIIIYWKRLFLFTYKPSNKFVWSKLWKRSFPLFIASLSNTIINNCDLIILGTLCSSEQVGIYSVAAQIATIPRMALLIINSVLSPQITILHNSDKRRELELLIQRIVAIIIGCSCILFVFYFLFGKLVLNLWGSAFKSAYPVLLILAIGHLFNLSTGPTGTTLVMCGYEKLFRNFSFTAMLFSVFSSIILTFFYGITGTAVAQALTILINNSIQVVAVRKKLGIQIIPRSLSILIR